MYSYQVKEIVVPRTGHRCSNIGFAACIFSQTTNWASQQIEYTFIYFFSYFWAQKRKDLNTERSNWILVKNIGKKYSKIKIRKSVEKRPLNALRFLPTPAEHSYSNSSCQTYLMLLPPLPQRYRITVPWRVWSTVEFLIQYNF